MVKLKYLLVIAICFITFNSCSFFNNQEDEVNTQTTTSLPNNNYGNYLAGRIAHYRQDFDSAANYYIKTSQHDSKNRDLLNKTYLLLASQGRISEAAKYAKTAKEQGDQNELANMILIAEAFKNNDYQTSIDITSEIKAPIYKKIISPFIKAWAYTGLNQYDKAIASLDDIKAEKGMDAIYHFHVGMINDYFNKKSLAQTHYEKIIADTNMELSVRSLEIICNFYLRINQKEKAIKISESFAKIASSTNILQTIHSNVLDSNPNSTMAIIAYPQDGLSEALFNISSIIKYNIEAIDFSHIFIRMAIYENPNNHLARILLANILEIREMYKDAIKVYDKIPPQSPAYYIAQFKKAGNLRNLENYKASEILLKSLILDYPNNMQLLLDLGDTLRLQNKYKEALKYYKMITDNNDNANNEMWQAYYASGISYERLNDWDKAEKMLTKALELNPNNVLILNYLGYSWLNQNKNQELAFEYIVQAYSQIPYNSSIIDSLGWAFYRLGKYDEAIYYLEKASDAEPSNPIINAHLGDAYWQGNRKNEARFQWNHALSLKDETGEIKQDEIRHKINNGMTTNPIIEINKTKLDKIISQIPEHLKK